MIKGSVLIMRKQMQVLEDFFAEYGMSIEKKRISKIFRGYFGVMRFSDDKEIVVRKMLIELIKGQTGERLVYDGEKFAAKIGMNPEKKRMLEFYGNSNYFVYDQWKERIKILPFRTFRPFEQITETFVQYKDSYYNILSEENKVEYDVRNAFNENEALNYLKEKVNYIFQNLESDDEMEVELKKMTDSLKVLLEETIDMKKEKERKLKEKERKKMNI